ncbi:hypothetical protein TNCV_637911 [Trichonephila clavipes]|nr:hypothetical protein TNCV_637911 [Trichonephila clavipes]
MRGRYSMPSTLRVHTEHSLIKSVGPKVLWVVSANPTRAGPGVPSPSVTCPNCRGGDKWCHYLSGGSPICHRIWQLSFLPFWAVWAVKFTHHSMLPLKSVLRRTWEEISLSDRIEFRVFPRGAMTVGRHRNGIPGRYIRQYSPSIDTKFILGNGNVLPTQSRSS